MGSKELLRDRRRESGGYAEARLQILLALVVFLVYFVSGPGRIDTIDAQIKFEVARTWVATGEPALQDPALAIFGVPGKHGIYSSYTFAASLTSLPLVWLGGVLNDARGEFQRFLYPLTSSLFGAALCVLMYGHLKALGLERRSSAEWALALAFASYLWPLAASAFDQAQQAFFLTFAVIFAWRAREQQSPTAAAACGLSLGFLLNYQPNLIILAPAAMLPLVLDRDGPASNWRRLLRERAGLIALAFAGVAIGVLAWFGFNFWRFGQLTVPGVGPAWAKHPGPIGNPIAGFLSLLISPGKSVFLYSPILVLGVLGWRSLAKRDRGLAWSIAGVSATQLAFFSCVSFFGSDWAWGPRYLLPVLPLWIAPAALWARGLIGRRRAMVGWIAAAGFAVQLLGISADYHIFFYSRGLNLYFWRADPWIYFDRSALLSRPVELARILRDGPPEEATTFVPNPYRYLSTYSVFGPKDYASAPAWMRHFSLFWLPKPWPLWASRLPPNVRAPVPVALALLAAVGGLGSVLVLRRELTRVERVMPTSSIT